MVKGIGPGSFFGGSGFSFYDVAHVVEYDKLETPFGTIRGWGHIGGEFIVFVFRTMLYELTIRYHYRRYGYRIGQT
ncbi:MAG: hypothetical protein IIT53_11810, partial [Fibrobacter sp.]|nr:hypothetical protein [Fibrobacter sp.]